MASRFVGRQSQLGDLAAAVASAAAGRGSLVLVGGEAGIGKSRLAEEAARAAGEAGVQVARARCWEDGAPGFWPWIQLLRATLRRDPGLPRRMPPLARRELELLLPELGSDADRDAAERGDGRARIDRIELLDAVITAFRVAAFRAPLLAIIDDVQWADAPSILGLRLIADELHDMPMCLVALERRPSPLRDPAVRAGLDGVAAAAHRVALGGLSESEVADLIEASGRPPSDRALAGGVRRRTGGNALYVVELLAGGASAAPGDDVGPGALDAVIPAGLRRLLDARIDRLGEASMDVLELTAVCGDEVDAGLLAAVLGRSDPRRDVGAAVADGVLVVASRVTERPVYRFGHPLLRDAILDRMPARRRTELHARASDGLIASLDDGEDERLPAIAEHLLAAVPVRDIDTAIDWTRRAADSASRQLAFERAAGLLELADDAAARHEPRRPETRLDLLMRLGEARLRSGLTADARAAFRGAADLAGRLGRPEELATAALGIGGGPSGFEVAMHDQRQVDLLQQALADLGDLRPDLRSRLTARLSIALTFLVPEERRAELSRQAVGIAEEAGDPGAAAYALGTLCDALAAPAFTLERLDATRRMLDLSIAAGDREQELVARRHRIVALAELGRVPELDTEIEAFARLAAEPGHSYSRWVVPMLRAMRHLMDGRLADAELENASAWALAQRAQSGEGEQLAVAQLWVIRREQGRVHELEGVVAGQLRANPGIAVWRLWMSVTLMEGPHAEQGAAMFRRMASDRFGELPRYATWLCSALIIAEAVARLGMASDGEWLYEELAPQGDLFAIDEWASANYGSLHRPLALLAALLGRGQQAETHFAAAIEAEARAGAVLCLARTRRELAAFRSSRAEGGPAGSPSGPVSEAGMFARRGEYWTVALGGETAQVRDSKGMRFLAVLLERPGHEVHSLDLVRAAEGLAPPGGEAPDAAAAADAGLRHDEGAALPTIDDEAESAYRARIEELGREIAIAEGAGDADRAIRAEDERGVLLAELASSRGLGGRRRVAGSPGERARLNATRAIRSALERIEAAAPAIGGHLRRTVRTGLFCAYEPDPRAPVRWSTRVPPGPMA